MTWESIKKFFFSLLIHVPLALDHTYFFFFGLKSPGLQYFPFKAVSFPQLRTWQILLILQVSYSNKPSLSFHPPLDIPLLKTLSDFAPVGSHPVCCTILFFPCHPHECAGRPSCTLFSSIVKRRPLVYIPLHQVRFSLPCRSKTTPIDRCHLGHLFFHPQLTPSGPCPPHSVEMTLLTAISDFHAAQSSG